MKHSTIEHGRLHTFGVRVLTGALLSATIILLLLASSHPYVIETAAAVLGVIGVYEILHAAGQADSWAVTSFAMLVAALLPYVPIPKYAYAMTLLYPIGLIGSVLLILFMQKVSLKKDGLLMLCCLWTVFLWRCAPALRACKDGLFWLSASVIAAEGNDIFAYCVGSALGKHPLCPAISPHKTVEGWIGGILGTVVLAVALFFFLQSSVVFPIGFVETLLFALCCAMLGSVGDLFFSACKRILGVKDFGNCLPGHGGILDRMDSLLFALPVALLWATYSHAGF